MFKILAVSLSLLMLNNCYAQHETKDYDLNALPQVFLSNDMLFENTFRENKFRISLPEILEKNGYSISIELFDNEFKGRKDSLIVFKKNNSELKVYKYESGYSVKEGKLFDASIELYNGIKIGTSKTDLCNKLKIDISKIKDDKIAIYNQSETICLLFGFKEGKLYQINFYDL